MDVGIAGVAGLAAAVVAGVAGFTAAVVVGVGASLVSF